MVNRQKNLSQYSFNSKFFTLPSGHKMHYVDEGSGPAVLLVHGNPTWSFYFRSVIQQLKGQFRVIAPDHIGSGYSQKPKSFSYRLKDHTNNLGELINHLGLSSVNLGVHDWGGAIALGWATEQPSRVSSLTLFNTAAFLSRDIPKRIRVLKTPIVGPFLMEKLNAFSLAACKMAVHKKLDAKARLGLLHPYKSAESRIGISRFVQDIPLSPAHPSYSTLQKTEQNLHKLKCPKLIMWGMKDFCFHGAFLKRWEEIYPEARVIRFPQGGHYLLEDETPEVLSHLKLFLSQIR